MNILLVLLGIIIGMAGITVLYHEEFESMNDRVLGRYQNRTLRIKQKIVGIVVLLIALLLLIVGLPE